MAGYDFFLSLPMNRIDALALVIPTLCLLSAIIHGLMYRRQSVALGWLSLGLCVVGTGLAAMVAVSLMGAESQHTRIPWMAMVTPWQNIQIGIGIYLTDVAGLMLLVVSIVSLLVHWFSMAYMAHDKGFNKYFAFLGLFTFSMYGIVLADNLLLLFFFWELVGLSSYLLIGFWYERKAAVEAAKKAFLINRIGDIGFLVGLLIVWWQFGTFDLEILAGQLPWAQDLSLGILSLAGVGLFLGAVGKSAQFPLQLWLPDAMEGPTPVSALIHAATMVAAGVYLLARVFFMLTPFTLDLIAYTGAITAFMGGVAALQQTDIKRVLAFSTISQLGFMVMAMGLGAYSAGIFHLITHAFFKAGLFLVAGTVIHYTHEGAQGAGASFDAQDMRLMGGLRKALPLVHICYVIMAAALVGIPLFSGFLSKEAILTVALERGMFQGGWLWVVPILALATVGLTAFYMFRQWSLVFGGTHRGQPDTFISNAKVPWSFSLPLVVLALLSIGFVYSPNPFNYLSSWLFSGLSVPENVFFVPSTIPALGHGWIALCSLGMIALGLGAGVYYAQRKGGFLQSGNGLLHRISLHNWYLDSLFQWGSKILGLSLARGLHRFDSRILDRAVNFLAVVQVVMAHLVAWVDKYVVDGAIGGVVTVTDGLGRWSRSLQSGVVQLMVLVAIAGMTLLFIWMMI